jgi:pentatricopeptide repeat protein
MTSLIYSHTNRGKMKKAVDILDEIPVGGKK